MIYGKYSCLAKEQRMKSLKVKILVAVAALYVVVAILGSIYFPEAGQQANHYDSPDRSDACFASQKFVRDELKAPSTAEFPDWTESNCQATQSGNVWTVRSFVDAENSFGAQVRSDYTAEMSYNTSRDSWTLNNLTIANP
jgi:hypothetical protein